MSDKKRVLIVDDEAGILSFIHEKLTMADYDVLTTTSGEEALALARSAKPDIILMDILMVPVSGLEVLDRLREFSQVPAIVFTGNEVVANMAKKIGATDYISKPLNPVLLINKIQQALANRQGK